MSRLLLCANPAASGFTGGLHREVVARLRDSFDVEAEWPKNPSETRRISTEAAAAGIETVVAMGGDGVVHHVANGLSGSTTALGIIPVGTTNVFGRLIGIPSNPKKAADYLCSDVEPRPVSTAMLSLDHGESGVEKRLATFSAGIGFDAEVVQVAEQEPYRKYRFGSLHYARTTASVVWKRFDAREPALHVTAGERSVDAVAVLVQIHSKYTYFGRLALRLGAYTPDTATVLVARSLPRRKIPSLLLRTASSRDLNAIDGIEVWEGVTSFEVKVESAEIPTQADGEILGHPRAISVEIHPDQLYVLAPPRPS